MGELKKVRCNTCDNEFEGTWNDICPKCKSGDVTVIEKGDIENNG